MIIDEMHPYTFFIETPLPYLKIRCRDASHLLSSLLLLFVYFLALPSPYILFQFIQLFFNKNTIIMSKVYTLLMIMVFLLLNGIPYSVAT